MGDALPCRIVSLNFFFRLEQSGFNMLPVKIVRGTNECRNVPSETAERGLSIGAFKSRYQYCCDPNAVTVRNGLRSEKWSVILFLRQVMVAHNHVSPLRIQKCLKPAEFGSRSFNRESSSATACNHI